MTLTSFSNSKVRYEPSQTQKNRAHPVVKKIKEFLYTEAYEVEYIDYISYEGLNLQFRNNLYALKYRKKDGLYFYDDKQLNLYGMASSIDDMIEQFSEDLFVIWTLYAKEEDNKLTRDALALKRILRIKWKEVN